MARALFDGLAALLEIAHFGFQRGVALLKLPVLRALRLDLPVHFPGAQPAALAEPQRILDQNDERTQYAGEDFQPSLSRIVIRAFGTPPGRDR